jgi:hypothetical protein
MDYLLWAEQQHRDWVRYRMETGPPEEGFDHSVGISDQMYAEALAQVASSGAAGS